MLVLAILAAAAFTQLPQGWVAAKPGGQCLIGTGPRAEEPVAMMLGAQDNANVMVMLTSPRFPGLAPGDGYVAELQLDAGKSLSPAMVQKNQQGLISVGFIMPADKLPAFGKSARVKVRLDGRNLADLAAPGRDTAAAALGKCLPSLKKAAAPAAAKPAPQASSVDDALAAAEAAGNRVAKTEGAGRPPQGGNAAAAMARQGALQAKSNEMLMMMRMNNHLIGGGSMADPNMGAVMWGLQN
ncbi:hypothetical protein L6Q21_04110 [Sandaracinobacter sp. RS1-74]|uniref:hypothetical protein n=1 Tax=Sandaracinobacteroides sayramensis TaxID=2913411 RepID=UPI001EDC6C21|nr:hypothetical protein [Sandaracinobacteroides sayramensis]MCG2840168.1 hypothetical protein [Sandaracinobacteroides sayramensis]